MRVQIIWKLIITNILLREMLIGRKALVELKMEHNMENKNGKEDFNLCMYPCGLHPLISSYGEWKPL